MSQKGVYLLFLKCVFLKLESLNSFHLVFGTFSWLCWVTQPGWWWEFLTPGGERGELQIVLRPTVVHNWQKYLVVSHKIEHFAFFKKKICRIECPPHRHGNSHFLLEFFRAHSNMCFRDRHVELLMWAGYEMTCAGSRRWPWMMHQTPGSASAMHIYWHVW